MKKGLFDTRNVLLIAGMAFLLLFYVGYLMYGLHYQIPGGVDYLAHYTAGYIMKYEQAGDVYNMNTQEAVQQQNFPTVEYPRFYPYNHPPILLGVLRLLTDHDYNLSFVRWLLTLLAFHLFSLAILSRLIHVVGWTPSSDTWIFCTLGLLFYPAFLNYIRGQDSFFFLIGILLWAYGILTSQDKFAGLGLALALMRPQIALALTLPFLFKRQKVLLWFVLFSFLLLTYSYWLIGFQGLSGFLKILLASGQGYGYDVDKMITLMGAILRAFPTIDPQLLHMLGYGGYVSAVVVLCIVWAKSRTIEFRHIGLAILVSMVFTPHMHNHDFVILLIPALGAATALIKSGTMPQKFASLLPLGVSLILLMKDVTAIYLLTYLLFIVLGILLLLPPRLKDR